MTKILFKPNLNQKVLQIVAQKINAVFIIVWLQEWRENVLGAIETDTMRALNYFERLSIGKDNKTKWGNLDPVVVALALNSTIFEDIKYSENSIILCGK